MRRVLYMAHPVSPTEEEIRQARENLLQWADEGDTIGDRAVHRSAAAHNAKRAAKWLTWLRRSFPETTFIAPWIASILSGEDDSDPTQREAGLVDACAVIQRCDGIVLCGGRISEGMRRETEAGLAFGLDDTDPDDPIQTFDIFDLTKWAVDPPSDTYRTGIRDGMDWDPFVDLTRLARLR